MDTQRFSYTSPKLELRSCPEKGGFGLFACQPISAGELLAFWGGQVVTTEQLEELPVERQTHGIQVDEDLYLVPAVHGDPSDYFNHSCEPNCGLGSPVSMIAIREIAVGEEACYDYAMSDSSDYDEFECHCGTPACRKRITGRDWMISELQKRYFGYFSPYLQRRIESMHPKSGNGSKPAIKVSEEEKASH